MSDTLPHRGVTLVLGGARSGKSAFAERIIRNSEMARIYVATATAGDAEMAKRIAHHRDDRGDGWRTIEEPLALTHTIDTEARPGHAVLIDCLTLWLSNLMEARRDLDAQAETLVATLASRAQTGGLIVLVSNELGMGLVPGTRLGREFRDAQGRLNQAVARAADHVAFVAAGLPLWLKTSHATSTTTETASS